MSVPWKTIKEAGREAISYIKQRKSGEISSLLTPWSKYNSVTGGIEWHTIHTIGGMSGSGKTAILNQLETELARLNPDEDFDILSFNFEMLARNLISRKIASELNITTQELHSAHKPLSGDRYTDALNYLRDELTKLSIYYVDVAQSVFEIRQTIERFIAYRAKAENNPNRGLVVLLDHTILVKGKVGDLERTVLVELMTLFNELKKKYKISFVLLTQLNREIESVDRIANPSQQFPRKKDIFGGDATFQFSDVVMVSMNPYQQLGLDVYGPKNWPTEGYLFWHFLKVREGVPGIKLMINELQFSRVKDAIREEGKKV